MILVWKFNRLARNTLDLLQMLQEVERYNVSFKSLTEPIDTTTPQGLLMLQMVASLGQYERSTIAQNVKMGMLARAREGKWNGGKVLGYDIVPLDETNKSTKKKEETVLKINQSESEIVRRIFKMYVDGKGYKAIANQLNKEGIKTKKGNDFSTIAIREILMNPVYISMIRYNVRQNWNEKRRRDINPKPYHGRRNT